MSDFPVSIPAGFAPVAAVVFGNAQGEGVVVNAEHPLPIGEAPFGGAVALTPDAEQPPRRGVAVVATVVGTVALKLADGSTVTLPVQPGLSILPFAVKALLSAGTSAAVTCYNLI